MAGALHVLEHVLSTWVRIGMAPAQGSLLDSPFALIDIRWAQLPMNPTLGA